MYKLRFAKRTSGHYPANEFLEALKVKDRDSWDKFMRAFEKFQEKGPNGVTGIYKALQGQGGIVQFTIWKQRILGFRFGNEVFLTNGFKKDQDETPPTEIQRAKDIRAEHQHFAGEGDK